MKNHFTFIALFVVLLTFTVNAKIWIVDNNPGVANGTFYYIDSAYAAASEGDTIHIIGSATTYNILGASGSRILKVQKKLTFLGPGYFFTENGILPVYGIEASVYGMWQLMADGISIVGLSLIENLNDAKVIDLKANNCRIERNRFINNLAIVSTTSANNVLIIRNHFETGTGINSLNLSNVIIAGNFLGTGVSGDLPGSQQIIVMNNVIGSPLYTQGELVVNNIFLTSYGYSNNTFQNNMTVVGQPAITTGTGNVNGVDPLTIFIGGSSPDAKYKLKPGSPAIGTGQNGVDMGMYGGSYPYIVSGIPPIPLIYELNVQAVANNATGVNVQVKVRSNP